MAREIPEVRILRHEGGAAVVPVHYSMDPEKDQKWAIKARAKVTDIEDWEKEMEINFLSVVGARCFTKFSVIANTGETEYDPALPLCLACDFNMAPMAWVVGQIHAGEHLHCLQEIYLREGTVDDACEVFLNDYGHHIGEVWLFGDRSGRGGTQQSTKSNYDLIKNAFMGHQFRVRMKVPTKNPTNVNAVASLNLRCQDKFGISRLTINAETCQELIKDMVQVVWEDGTSGGTKQIKKVRKREDPYFWRGHLSDAIMYLAHRMWPVRTEQNRKSKEEQEYDKELLERKRRNKKKRLIGAYPMPRPSRR